jgi:outer membrane protein assembly factor BamE (lipoprotein component of BamABCDE complex)
MITLIFRKLIYIPLLVFALTSCTPEKVVQGPFLKLSAIETELKKGVSTKMDVQRIMGSPQGLGGAVFPVTAEEHEVWYYQNIQLDNIVSQQSHITKESYITMDMHQKVLLVFFSKGLFDGFLWFTGTIKGASQ